MGPKCRHGVGAEYNTATGEEATRIGPHGEAAHGYKLTPLGAVFLYRAADIRARKVIRLGEAEIAWIADEIRPPAAYGRRRELSRRTRMNEDRVSHQRPLEQCRTALFVAI